MNQIGRNLRGEVDGLLNGKRYLIRDRDQLFTAEFLSLLGEAGVASVGGSFGAWPQCVDSMSLRANMSVKRRQSMDHALQLVIEMNQWIWSRFKDDL